MGTETLPDVEALRMEVARLHGVLLSKDDPIFVTVTLSHLALESLLQRIEALSSALEKEGASRMQQEIETVKRSAEAMIAGTARLLSDTVKDAAEKQHAALVAAVTRKAEQMEAAEASVDRGRSAAVIAAGISVAGALLAVGAVVLVVLLR